MNFTIICHHTSWIFWDTCEDSE